MSAGNWFGHVVQRSLFEREKKGEKEGREREDVSMWRCECEREKRRCEYVKMSRCEDEQMWRWEDVKIRRCEDEQMWRWEDVKMSRCEDEKMWGWEDVKMSRCEDEQMWRWEDVKMSRCEDEKMWRWADVKMRRWRWADVKMRRCEDEKVWRWEGVKMRRWDTDPTIGRTLRSDALGKNIVNHSASSQYFFVEWSRHQNQHLLTYRTTTCPIHHSCSIQRTGSCGLQPTERAPGPPSDHKSSQIY